MQGMLYFFEDHSQFCQLRKMHGLAFSWAILFLIPWTWPKFNSVQVDFSLFLELFWFLMFSLFIRWTGDASSLFLFSFSIEHNQLCGAWRKEMLLLHCYVKVLEIPFASYLPNITFHVDSRGFQPLIVLEYDFQVTPACDFVV